ARLAGLDQRSLGNTAGILLRPGVALAPDLQLEPFGKRVDAAHADSVQSAGHLVTVGIELAAGVELGHDDLRRADAFLFVDTDRNAAAIVDYGYGIVDMDGYRHIGGMSCEGFVDGVVDDLVHQVVQAHLARGTDV